MPHRFRIRFHGTVPAGVRPRKSGHPALEQVEGRGVGIQDQGGPVGDRLPQGPQAQEEDGQFGLLGEDLVVLGGFGLGLAGHDGRLGLGPGEDLPLLAVGLGPDPDGLALALALVALDQAHALLPHALEDLAGVRLGQTQLLDAHHPHLDAVEVPGGVPDGGEHLVLDPVEPEFLRPGVDQVAEGMLADHSVLGAAHHVLQVDLGLGHVPVEAVEEGPGVGDPPGDEHGDHQVAAVAGGGLLESALEVADALVEAVDPLDGPGQAEVGAGIDPGRGRPSEGGDHRHLGLPHLEDEEQAEEDQDQDAARDERDWMLLHVG